MGKDKSRRGKGRTPRGPSALERRAAALHAISSSATSAWLKTDNPIKRRIASLEVAWREGIGWLVNDIQSMFSNFAVLIDGHEKVDINVQALKSVLIEKGIITDEEFQAKMVYWQEVYERVREQKEEQRRAAEEEAERQAELTTEERNQVAEAERQAMDGSKVDQDLVDMKRAAIAAAEDESPYPSEATVFGGGG